jgi:hypothetical protein
MEPLRTLLLGIDYTKLFGPFHDSQFIANGLDPWISCGGV